DCEGLDGPAANVVKRHAVHADVPRERAEGELEYRGGTREDVREWGLLDRQGAGREADDRAQAEDVGGVGRDHCLEGGVEADEVAIQRQLDLVADRDGGEGTDRLQGRRVVPVRGTVPLPEEGALERAVPSPDLRDELRVGLGCVVPWSSRIMNQDVDAGHGGPGEQRTS